MNETRSMMWSRYRRDIEEFAKNNRMNSMVTLTIDMKALASRPYRTMSAVAALAQAAVQEVCVGYAIGAADKGEGNNLHDHVLCSRKDARALKDWWQSRDLGHVDIRYPDDDPTYFKRTISYVREKWDRSRADHLIFNAPRNSLRGM